MSIPERLRQTHTCGSHTHTPGDETKRILVFGYSSIKLYKQTTFLELILTSVIPLIKLQVSSTGRHSITWDRSRPAWSSIVSCVCFGAAGLITMLIALCLWCSLEGHAMQQWLQGVLCWWMPCGRVAFPSTSVLKHCVCRTRLQCSHWKQMVLPRGNTSK